MKPNRLLWQTSASLDELNMVAQRLASSLATTRPFCLWLEGEMGTGKTTLTGAILHCLGLAAEIPVTSPTYTYLNEYEIEKKRFAHMDLYRADLDFAPDELGLLDDQSYEGLFVEWPQQIAPISELQATHRLVLAYGQNPSLRQYTLYATSIEA